MAQNRPKPDIGPKMIFAQRKVFGFEKDFCHKKPLDLKGFRLQGNFLSKNIGEEKLLPGQMLRGQMSL